MGQILSTDAFAALNSNNNYYLVDVRTEMEWKEYGIPDVKNIFCTSFNNVGYTKQEKKLSKLLMSFKDKSNSNIIFICKSGVRSFYATQYSKSIGYKNCLNIIDGFVGNELGKGWKNNNLPIRFR